jgi:hypothetical protein
MNLKDLPRYRPDTNSPSMFDIKKGVWRGAIGKIYLDGEDVEQLIKNKIHKLCGICAFFEGWDCVKELPKKTCPHFPIFRTLKDLLGD